MAVYKVPQDVEAEDKLIGPFGFRQFIYLLIAAGAGGLSFLFIKAPMPIPFFSIFSIPVVIGMVVLALPLRKDQPMEIYLAAVIRFMLKPKSRLWINDGSNAGITIDAPQAVQQVMTREISQEQALDQLNYLSRIVDTRGWAAKGVDMPVPATATASTTFTEDIMDEDTEVAKSFDTLLAKQKEVSRKAAIERMHSPAQTTAAPASSEQTTPKPSQAQPTPPKNNEPADTGKDDKEATDSPAKKPRYNPYPKMHQQVLSPIDKLRASTFRAPNQDNQKDGKKDDSVKLSHDSADETSDNKDMTPHLSPDIMRLANNNDLSIQAIANEAHRVQQAEEGEVVVQLH